MESTMRGKIAQSMQDMGTTPETVATFLQGQGIKGIRCIKDMCPLATYFSQTFDCHLEVGLTYSYILDEDGETYATVDHPKWIMQFVDMFDEGKFPTLEETSNA